MQSWSNKQEEEEKNAIDDSNELRPIRVCGQEGNGPPYLTRTTDDAVWRTRSTLMDGPNGAPLNGFPVPEDTRHAFPQRLPGFSSFLRHTTDLQRMSCKRKRTDSCTANASIVSERPNITTNCHSTPPATTHWVARRISEEPPAPHVVQSQSKSEEVQVCNGFQERSRVVAPSINESRTRHSSSDSMKRFLKDGFDTGSPFRRIKLRSGRWTTQETMYAIKIVQDALLNELKTPTRRYIREVLQEYLHTTTARIHNKFKGHAALSYLTCQVGHSDSKKWQKISSESPAFHSTLPLPEQLVNETKEHNIEELRQEFLKSIAKTCVSEYDNL